MESFLVKEIIIRGDIDMRGKRFSPDQIIRILKEAELGGTNMDICRKYAISEQTDKPVTGINRSMLLKEARI